MFLGTSISSKQLLEVADRHSVTPNFAFKLAVVRPEPNVWDFREAGFCVQWAKEHGMRIRGNCLMWHLHIPDWLYALPPEKVEAELKNYVQTIVAAYPEVAAWDVVNEKWADAGVVRNSIWQRVPDIMPKIFHWAHEANPNAMLCYNDYRPMAKDKWLAIFAELDYLRVQKVPVHCVGVQLHHYLRRYLAEGILGWQSLKWIVEQTKFRGLEIEFTEVSVLDDLRTPWLREKAIGEIHSLAAELGVLGVTDWNWD